MAVHDCQNLDLLALDSEHDEKRETFDRTDSSVAVLERKLLRVALHAIDRFPHFFNEVVSKVLYLGVVPIA